MTDDYKKRIEAAVGKYVKKNDPTRVKRKNEAPERDLQKKVLTFLNSIGWSIHNIESKSTYSQSASRYIGQAAIPGMPDLIGNDDQGRAVYIEMKAKGRRGTLRPAQREFLIRKIETNCFAIVADSVEMISENYFTWQTNSDRKKYLLSLLPTERVSQSDDLF